MQNDSLYQDEPVCWHPPLSHFIPFTFHSVMLRMHAYYHILSIIISSIV